MQQLQTKNTIATYDYQNLHVLSKEQVLQLLTFLTERINRHFIMMGGVLFTIRKNKWYEPSATFADFCDTLVGLQYRKSMYLIQIYEALVTNHIPFEEVSELGFTKLTLLSTHLTADNYKSLLEWAIPLSTQAIEDELKATVAKAKGFIDKAKGNDTLSPDFKGNVKVKTVYGNPSDLKQLLTVTPVELVVKALKMLYPEKDFVIA